MTSVAAAPATGAGAPTGTTAGTGAAATKPPLVLVQSVQAAALKVLFECLKDVLHDLSLEFTPSGIRVLAMDASKSTMVNLRLDAEKFDQYTINTRSVTAGVSAGLLFRLLKVAGSSDVVTLKMHDTDILTLVLSNDSGRVTSFDIKAMDVDTHNVEMPEASFEAVIKMPSTQLQRLVRDMQHVGPIITFEKTPEVLRLSSVGDLVSQCTEIPYLSDPSEPVQEAKLVRNHFSLKHLCLFTKCSGLCATTTLYLSSDLPLIVEFQVANLGQLRFVLAPLDI